MIKQFFRLYLTVMIPVLVLVALAHHYGSHANTRAAYVEGLRTGLQARFANTRAQISALRLDDWESSLPFLQATFASDVELDVAPTAMRRLKSNREETARFQRGEVAFVLKSRGLTRVYQQIPGTPLTVGSSVLIPSERDVSPTLYVIATIATVSTIFLWIWFHPSWVALERLGMLTEEVASAPERKGVGRDGSRFGQPLAGKIDRMSTRLGDLLRVRRTQSNSVAHELTAPIAHLSFALEILRENPSGPGAQALVLRMREDLRELDHLVAESLESARLDNGQRLVLAPASLNALMRAAVDEAQQRPHGKQVTWTPTDDAADRVVCDARQVGRALSNLLRNATRHAGSSVGLSTEAIGSATWFHVDDDGEGVPEAQRDRLFEPFARGEGQTVAASRGYGLGLAIVRQIAVLHGGDARIDASPLGGARVSFGW